MESPNERMEQLVNTIQQRWGVQALRKLEQVAVAHTTLPTGYSALDKMLHAGGIPRGILTCVSGHPTSGATTLALDILAQAQNSGEVTVYIDSSHAVDPEYVARRGIDLNRLLVVCPLSHDIGFDIARDITLSGGAGLIVFDLGSAGSDIQTAQKALRRLTTGLSRTPYAVLCLSATRDALHAAVSGQSGLHLQMERRRWLERPAAITGYETQITFLKNKFGPSGQAVVLPILLDRKG